MRLRLRIERCALPATQALWPVKDGKSTVAQLLQSINGVFPLEGDTWGLEDYSVAVGGYECLHYHELEDVCKDEDEVVVRPLQYAEVRARTLAGRAQISADGRHLVDGVAFGRPCLKAPVRPEVRIPPRKRRKLLEDGENVEVNEQPLLLVEHEEHIDKDDDEEEDEDEDDEDFDMQGSEDASSSEESSSESEDEDSGTSGSDASDTSSEDTDSDDTSSSESEESWNGISNSAPPTPTSNSTVKLTNGLPHAKASPLTGSKRKRGSHDEDQETEVRREIKKVTVDKSSPGEGDPKTRLRNARRRDSKKLNHLKELGVLPQNATLPDFYKWEASNPGWRLDSERGGHVNADGQDTDHLKSATDNLETASEVEGKTTTKVQMPNASEKVLDHVPVSEDKTSQRSKHTSKAAHRTALHMEDQRLKLLSAIASGGIDVSASHVTKGSSALPSHTDADEDDAEPPQEFSSKQQPARTGSTVAADMTTEEVDKTLRTVSTSERRAQLDLAGSKRLLFGSLGVKVPKTQEERDRIQKKLAERPKRNVLSAQDESTGLNPSQINGTNTVAGAAETNGLDIEDAVDWRDKINLTAVECCEEGITLSTPPFPFYQRWDPQQRKKKARNSSVYSNRRRGKQNAQFVETYDKYNTDGGGDALNYDDEAVEVDEYWEEGALLDGEADDEEAKDDGFPPLPTNMEELPALQEIEAQKGDFVAFTELACDESTEWQPKTVIRTAKIAEAPMNDGDLIWQLQLSSRDFKPRVFDNEGNRVYGKFEMPDDDGDAEDDGRRDFSWYGLGVVRLVLRPETETNGKM